MGKSQKEPAKAAKWIWYPCEFEISLANEVLFRRDYRGNIEHPFWRMDGLYNSVFFIKWVELAEPEQITLQSDSVCSVIYGSAGKFISSSPDGTYTLPEGKYELMITAYNKDYRLPTILVCGKTIFSDESWFVSNTKARGDSVPVGFSDVLGVGSNPHHFTLETVETEFSGVRNDGPFTLYDYGKETFGYIKLYNVQGKGQIRIYYGESTEEACDIDRCETYDFITFAEGCSEYVHHHSRGFRYVYIIPDETVTYGKAALLYEYLPVEYRGKFKCSNDKLNRIFDVSLYTLHLNSREFFLDGIKRDRWIWAGDAYQSYMLNYYSFFDKEINRRTMCALRGKGQIEHHINQILDYTFYWFNSLYDHYMYMEDITFLHSIYAKAVKLMDFCLGLRSENGFIEGRPEKDWVFVDWAEMPKEGVLSVEQILFYRSLWVMSRLSDILGHSENTQKYDRLAEELKQRIFDVFYDEERGVFYNNYADGKVNPVITKYANIFAVMYDLVDQAQKQKMIENAILNEEIPKLVTPYAMFYELISLCEAGQHKDVRSMIESYWGGMLDLGATTFWELYDPGAANHLEMYGRPYSKSLCHAWGASPIYLLGRYFLGVHPMEPGYRSFVVEPQLGGLEWIQGTVPTPDGDIEVAMDKEYVIIHNKTPYSGILKIDSKKSAIEPNSTLRIRTDSLE